MDNKKHGFLLNPLVEAQRNFNVMETRLFYLGLQDVNPHISEKDKFYDKNFPDTFISSSELKKMFGYGQYLTEIKKVCRNLIGSSIEINFKDGFDLYTVYQHIKYKDGQGLFLKFNEDMRPFILEIYENYKNYGFTKIDMQQIFILGSTYAMRLLELLLKYRSTSQNGIIERELKVDELRTKLNVPANAYKGKMCNFRQFVLDNPIKDINKNTQYFVYYEAIKTGRKITSFKFFCNCNNTRKDNEYTETIESQQALEIQASPAMLQTDIQASDNVIDKLIRYGFSVDNIEKFINVCGSNEELKARLEFGEKRVKEKKEKGEKFRTSETGFLRRAIEENWLGSKKEEEKAIEREIEAVKTNAEWENWARINFSDEAPPKAPERAFNINNPIENAILNLIKKCIKNRHLDQTARERLNDYGLTVSRFIELYM